MAEDKPSAKRVSKPNQVIAKLDEAAKILDGMSGDVWQTVSARLAALRAAVEKYK